MFFARLPMTAQTSGSGITAPHCGSTTIAFPDPIMQEGGFRKKLGTPGSTWAFFISSLLLNATFRIIDGLGSGGAQSVLSSGSPVSASGLSLLSSSGCSSVALTRLKTSSMRPKPAASVTSARTRMAPSDPRTIACSRLFMYRVPNFISVYPFAR